LSRGNEQRREEATADDDAVDDEDGFHVQNVPQQGDG
jgi:hypothetical protein